MSRAIVLSVFLFFQGTASRPEFEVSLLKASPPSAPGEPININLGTLRNGRLTFGNASLSDLLKYAYGIVADEQIAGPDWLKSKEVRFDIIAQTPPATTQAQAAFMLQSLLAERLKLAVHHEDRPLSYVALVVGKNGTKLKPAAEATAPNLTALGHITHSHMSMPLLATLLSRFERQLVLDKTNLPDFYTVKLEWTPENVRARAADGGISVVDPNGPSLSTALSEQLGLRLESRKGPVDVLVVDHVEKIPQ